MQPNAGRKKITSCFLLPPVHFVHPAHFDPALWTWTVDAAAVCMSFSEAIPQKI